MFKARFLTLPEFRFSKEHPAKIATDTFRGLSRFGPYGEVQGQPKFGFVFPQRHKDDANNLYRALRNGVGYFRGFSNMFRVPFEKEQVFPITGFELRDYRNPHDSARAYSDAILNWTRNHNVNPDLIFVLHPKTPSWQVESPYHACKAALLAQGYLSQNVTLELVNNSAQFEWSVANIALAAFVKLGGIPWVVHRRSERQQFVIGVGRSEMILTASRLPASLGLDIRERGPLHAGIPVRSESYGGPSLGENCGRESADRNAEPSCAEGIRTGGSGGSKGSRSRVS